MKKTTGSQKKNKKTPTQKQVSKMKVVPLTLKQQKTLEKRRDGVGVRKGSNVPGNTDVIDMRKGGNSKSLYVQTLNPYQKARLAREITPDYQSINGFIVGMFDYYCGRGAMSYNPQDYINSLFYFANQVFLAMSGQRLTVKKLPYGFYCFLEALKPTSVHYKTGNIYYTWNVDGFDTSTLTAFAAALTPSDAIATNVVGWPYLNNILIPSVVPAVLEASFSNLIGRMYVMRPVKGQKFQMTDIIDIEEEKIITPFLNDSSVFAGVQELVGVGAAQIGGFNIVLMHEVFIKYPMFAKFVPNNIVPNTSRSFESSSFSAFSAFGAGRSLLSTTTYRLKNHNRVIMKPIDMGDLYIFLGSLINAAAVRVSRENLTVPPTQTILNPLDIFILIRECVRQLKGAGDGQLTLDTGPTDFFQANYYGPYNSGPSLYAGQIDMPFAFVENLKALSAVTFSMPTGGVLDWVPVFGTFTGENSIAFSDQLPHWTLPVGTFPRPYIGLPPTISLFDFFDVLGNSYVGTNVPNLHNVVESWNIYLNQFQSCMEITKFSPEISTNAMSVLPMTRYYASPPIGNEGVLDNARLPLPNIVTARANVLSDPSNKLSRKLSVKEVVPCDSELSLAKKAKILTQIVWPTTNDRRKTFACSTSNAPFNITLCTVFNTWVWPSNFTYNINAPNYSIDYYQSLYIESHRLESPYSRQLFEADQILGIDFTEFQESNAVTWTKPPAEDSSENSKALTRLNDMGYGGFFSNVISDLVTSQLNLPPEIASFVRNVSSIIPL